MTKKNPEKKLYEDDLINDLLDLYSDEEIAKMQEEDELNWKAEECVREMFYEEDYE